METEKDSQEVQHKKILKSVQKTHQKSDRGSDGFPKVLLFEKVVKAPRRLTKSRMEAEKDSQVQHIKNQNNGQKIHQKLDGGKTGFPRSSTF